MVFPHFEFLVFLWYNFAMSEKETRKKIQEIANKIAQEFKPEKIILFGSYAWGKPGPNSDIDLFIVKETENARETAGQIDSYLWGRDVPMDIIVYKPGRIQKSIDSGNFFVRDIVTKGKILYDRQSA